MSGPAISPVTNAALQPVSERAANATEDTADTGNSAEDQQQNSSGQP